MVYGLRCAWLMGIGAPCTAYGMCCGAVVQGAGVVKFAFLAWVDLRALWVAAKRILLTLVTLQLQAFTVPG